MKDLKEAASSPEFRNNRPEGNACLVLAHPNIVKIVYHRLDHPKPFLVTEYCEGGALNRDQILGLPLVQKLEMFSKICSAVGFAHNRGIEFVGGGIAVVLLQSLRQVGEELAAREAELE